MIYHFTYTVILSPTYNRTSTSITDTTYYKLAVIVDKTLQFSNVWHLFSTLDVRDPKIVCNIKATKEETKFIARLMLKYRITVIYRFQVSGKWTLQSVKHRGQIHVDNTSGAEIHVSFRHRHRNRWTANSDEIWLNLRRACPVSTLLPVL